MALLHWSTTSQAQVSNGGFGRAGKQKVTIFGRLTNDILLNAGDGLEERKKTASRQQEALIFVPITQSPDSSYGAMAKAQSLEFNQLESHSNFKPVDKLSSYEYGLSWTHEQWNENSWGLNASVGSASDQPFQGSDVLTVNATLTRKYVTSPKTSWLFFLNYSNNRSVLSNIPIPGFAYSFANLSGTQGALVGLPFFTYWWRPTAKAYLSSAVFLPSKAALQAGYMVWGAIQANLKVEYGQQVYMRHLRETKDVRIFYDTKKAAFSLKSYFGPATFIELEIARVFDRSFYDGKNAFNLKSQRLRVPDDWQGTLAAQVSF